MHKKYENLLHLCAVFFLIVVAYAGSTSGGWYLDDTVNIVDNIKLHVEDLSPASLVAAATAKPGAPLDANNLYRPTAMLTFAVNYVFSGTDPFPYRIVNIAIHIITASFLYLTLVLLLQSAKMPPAVQQRAATIAVVATLLWCLAPIQTQAVTYIIQRMTSLAGMFSVLAMYLYIRMRVRHPDTIRGSYVVALVLMFLLGLGSKEIAVLIPLNLLLIEVFFFKESRWTSRNTLYLLLSLVLIYLIAALVTGRVNIFSLFTSGDYRPFTTYERLLTEFRIVTYYLFQILVPNAQNLTLVHDVPISTSWLKPPATLAAFIFLGALFAAAVASIQKYRLFSFAVVFFFVNHSIESTIIPLELAFEHRNYIPSLFLFTPIAAVLVQMAYTAQWPRIVRSFCFVLIASYIAVAMFNTMQRNHEWTDRAVFWHKEGRHNERSPGVALELGNLYLDVQEIEVAKKLYGIGQNYIHRAQNRPLTEAALFNGLGIAHFRLEQYDHALQQFNACLDIIVDDPRCWANKTRTLVQLHEYEQAEQSVDVLLRFRPHSDEYNFIKGVIYLRQEMYAAGLPFLENAYNFSRGGYHATIHLAYALFRIGKVEQALATLRDTAEEFASDKRMLLFTAFIHQFNNTPGHAGRQLATLRTLYPEMTLDDMVALGETPYGIRLMQREDIVELVGNR
ncbi:tetratricopeptide repeat protein [Desulfobulbus alkaliphilus]|uniref:tetratricopeptide repeat protein n=1 Tax=Desulfobulbus alkaliphilus TaxID=869814 RepID=UPI001964EDFD|nr:hypothetical protein [Desulfobulbus alkaliphilus]MBM9537091.1 hypothetical protein [Desulfobulbus alkaliphilus]